MSQLALIPEPAFAPSLPSPNTMAARLLGMLLAGETIDHAGFQYRTGSWRVAAYVEDLRRLGWPILTEHAPAPSETAPGRWFGRYSLPPEAIAAAKG